MNRDTIETLRQAGIQPSPQRVAVAEYVLHTTSHPTAEQVLAQARKRCSVLSRATVYNTLRLFVRKGLLRELSLSGGKIVFDPNTDAHHHFIEEDSGRIQDLPWEWLQVTNVHALPGIRVSDYQVVVRGRKTKAPAR